MNGLLHKYIYYILTLGKARQSRNGKDGSWQRQGKAAWQDNDGGLATARQGSLATARQGSMARQKWQPGNGKVRQESLEVSSSLVSRRLIFSHR